MVELLLHAREELHNVWTINDNLAMVVSKPDPRTKGSVPRLQLWEPAQNEKMLTRCIYYQDNLNKILHAAVIPTNAPLSYHR